MSRGDYRRSFLFSPGKAAMMLFGVASNKGSVFSMAESGNGSKQLLSNMCEILEALTLACSATRLG
jgi:hypothetical protein